MVVNAAQIRPADAERTRRSPEQLLAEAQAAIQAHIDAAIHTALQAR